MQEIQQLKKKYSIDPSAFDKIIKDYYTFCNTINNPEFSVEKAHKAFDDACNMFEEILFIGGTEGKVKEHANFFWSEIKDHIPQASFITSTTDINIMLGLFRDFYIAMPLNNAHNIKFMKDEFWSLLFQLSTLGEFRFREFYEPTKKMRHDHPQLFNKTGNYYKFLRNYFLHEAHNGHDPYVGNISNIGTIFIKWDNDSQFEIILPKIIHAFSIMYKINFLLWKHDNKAIKF